MTQLSIIIPTKDRGEIFYKTLACAIQATLHTQAEIIIVNDSRASRPEIGGYKTERIRLIDNPKSGVAAARNAGAKSASSELLLFLDDDIQINKDSIDQTLALHASHPNVCMNPDWIYPNELQETLSHKSFGRFLVSHNFTSFKGWYNHAQWKDNSVFESPMVASFYLSISKENFNKSGGYDEAFPHAGFEDYDFPVRLRKMGVRLLINTRAVVYHNEEDRQDLNGWLQRQVRGGETRRIGVQIGYRELAIPYSPGKKIILNSLLIVKPVLVALAGMVPNFKDLDIIYFRLVLTLQAICIFEGYHKSL